MQQASNAHKAHNRLSAWRRFRNSDADFALFVDSDVIIRDAKLLSDLVRNLDENSGRILAPLVKKFAGQMPKDPANFKVGGG